MYWGSNVCSSDLRPHSSHGRGGPMTISPMREAHPLCREFLSACHEAGMPLLADYHGGDMQGAFPTDATQRDGWRCSTAKAFLRPARDRATLTILPRIQADTLTFDCRRPPRRHLNRNRGQPTLRARHHTLTRAGPGARDRTRA